MTSQLLSQSKDEDFDISEFIYFFLDIFFVYLFIVYYYYYFFSPACFHYVRIVGKIMEAKKL